MPAKANVFLIRRYSICHRHVHAAYIYELRVSCLVTCLFILLTSVSVQYTYPPLFIHSPLDPVSRKSVKSSHSIRNRYSSQWTLTKCQASTPARTLTSDWRTVGSQHGITVTESDSYSASLSQDTGWHSGDMTLTAISMRVEVQLLF